MDELLLIALLCCFVAAVWAIGAVVAALALLGFLTACASSAFARWRKRRAENSNLKP